MDKDKAVVESPTTASEQSFILSKDTVLKTIE